MSKLAILLLDVSGSMKSLDKHRDVTKVLFANYWVNKQLPEYEDSRVHSKKCGVIQFLQKFSEARPDLMFIRFAISAQIWHGPKYLYKFHIGPPCSEKEYLELREEYATDTTQSATTPVHYFGGIQDQEMEGTLFFPALQLAYEESKKWLASLPEEERESAMITITIMTDGCSIHKTEGVADNDVMQTKKLASEIKEYGEAHKVKNWPKIVIGCAYFEKPVEDHELEILKQFHDLLVKEGIVKTNGNGYDSETGAQGIQQYKEKLLSYAPGEMRGYLETALKEIRAKLLKQQEEASAFLREICSKNPKTTFKRSNTLMFGECNSGESLRQFFADSLTSGA
ncbi:MAG: hypothetical protein HY043_03185 [Verrucomicrobia bacterium]|nr:hypothetical protein [Verrucomicrobiota bacterium]